MLVRTSGRRTLAAVTALVALAAGCASTDEPPAAKPSAKPSGPTVITFATYGPQAVIDAYREIAARFMVDHPKVKVKIRPYATHEEAMGALRRSTEKGDAPDVFLMDHDDLSGLEDTKAVRRVDDLLAEREVDFGDGYTRNGLEAFSADAALQCMPLDVSPMVVYYNPKLIELDRIADPGSRPVTQESGWSLDEFATAALQPRRPGVRGLYVEPDLEQIAPFIWSGGGDVVDDTDTPTTLTLSDGKSESAVEKLLEIVRNPALTFNQRALSKRSALQRFEDGKLGMMLGFRDLTPVLRKQQTLTFDVMPLPRVSSSATITRMSGLCISAGSQHSDKAADFLAELISDKDASILAATGYVMPSNVDVLNGDDFLQTGQRPLHSEVFPHELRRAQMLPSTTTWPSVASTTAVSLTHLFYDPVIAPLQDRLEAIDEASVPLLTPSEATPSSSPSSSPSSTP
jgi:multiple sugar transport system substrate-binding protein